MEATFKGAKKHGGLAVGILPGLEKDVNFYVDVRIVANMGDGRNLINMRSVDVVIAVHGRAGNNLGVLSGVFTFMATSAKAILSDKQ